MSVKKIKEKVHRVGVSASPVVASMCAAGASHRAVHGKTRSLITFSPTMFSMVEEIPVAASHDVALLIVAETGSGKSHLAHLIHELSPRSGESFLSLDCGAVQPDRIEGELFGYVQGAFPDAEKSKGGKLTGAGAGTLYIDEIDVLSPEMQAKLLRVIEVGEHEPLGSSTTQKCRARLILASNRDLEELVERGLFRKDLYYRLNALKFVLPSLRHRLEDVEFLTSHFAAQTAKTHGIALQQIDDEVFEALRCHDWPGNIRELENAVRRAVLYCRDGVLKCADFPPPIRPESLPHATLAELAASSDGSETGSLEARLERLERKIIEDVLRRNHDSRIISAKELGISRVTLYNKMKKLGIFK